MADDVGRLIQTYLAEARTASATRKLSVLMDLKRSYDPRVFLFLLQVLTDRREQSQVRRYVLKSIRNGGLTPDDRERAAAAAVLVLSDRGSLNLRIEATLALRWFIDVSGVIAVLVERRTPRGARQLEQGAPCRQPHPTPPDCLHRHFDFSNPSIRTTDLRRARGFYTDT